MWIIGFVYINVEHFVFCCTNQGIQYVIEIPVTFIVLLVLLLLLLSLLLLVCDDSGHRLACICYFIVDEIIVVRLLTTVTDWRTLLHILPSLLLMSTPYTLCHVNITVATGVIGVARHFSLIFHLPPLIMCCVYVSLSLSLYVCAESIWNAFFFEELKMPVKMTGKISIDCNLIPFVLYRISLVIIVCTIKT